MITIVSLSLVSGIVTKSSIEKYQILIGRHLLTGDDTVTQPDESVIELFDSNMRRLMFVYTSANAIYR